MVNTGAASVMYGRKVPKRLRFLCIEIKVIRDILYIILERQCLDYNLQLGGLTDWQHSQQIIELSVDLSGRLSDCLSLSVHLCKIMDWHSIFKPLYPAFKPHIWLKHDPSGLETTQPNLSYHLITSDNKRQPFFQISMARISSRSSSNKSNNELL